MLFQNRRWAACILFGRVDTNRRTTVFIRFFSNQIYFFDQSCFPSKSIVAAQRAVIVIAIEMTVGIKNSDTEVMPEISSTFFEVKRNGLNLASGSTIPSRDMIATIPPVKRILVKVCLKTTQPRSRMLRYKKPISHR